ncbi:hypothetical protein V8F33_013762 [Rhypophila sp. PSN 637]
MACVFILYLIRHCRPFWTILLIMVRPFKTCCSNLDTHKLISFSHYHLFQTQLQTVNSAYAAPTASGCTCASNSKVWLGQTQTSKQ